MVRTRSQTKRERVDSDVGERAFRVYRDHYARDAYTERVRRQRQRGVRALAALAVTGRTVRENEHAAVEEDLVFLFPQGHGEGGGFVNLTDAQRAEFRAENRRLAAAEYAPRMTPGRFDTISLSRQIWADIAFADVDELMRQAQARNNAP